MTERNINEVVSFCLKWKNRVENKSTDGLGAFVLEVLIVMFNALFEKDNQIGKHVSGNQNCTSGIMIFHFELSFLETGMKIRNNSHAGMENIGHCRIHTDCLP